MNDKTRPFVTIAIPTYNRADGYLKDALQSALSQTYDNMEIIVSDNCSSDDTSSLVSSYKDPRLHYFRHEENIGPINNFNFCLNQAKGDYFLLLHDDDLIDADFVEICMRRANFEKQYGIIRTGIRMIDENGKTLGESPNLSSGLSSEAYFRAWFSSKVAWYLPSTLFNTEKLRGVGGFVHEYKLLQDAVALVRLEVQIERLDIEDIKASFRKHPDEITFAVNVKEWANEFARLLNLICDTLPGTDASFRSEGLQFFTTLSYNRAKAVKSPLKRFFAYLSVYKIFKFRHLPPFIISWYKKTPVHLILRKTNKTF